MSMPTQPETAFTMPTETPLWSYGFEWDCFKAFAVKRRCKKEGGKFWPPLEDDVELERDPDPKLALKQKQATNQSREISRAVDVLHWAKLFLQNKAGNNYLFRCVNSAHTGKTGTQDRFTMIVDLASARAWKRADIDMAAVLEEWELPDEKSMAVLREYLGEPAWFLETEYVRRNKLFPALESGEFQAVVGIPVESHPTVGTSAQVRCELVVVVARIMSSFVLLTLLFTHRHNPRKAPHARFTKWMSVDATQVRHLRCLCKKSC